MTQIDSFPPDEASKAAAHAVPGTRITPGVVGALDGPTLAGPEAAGALTLLHTTFVDDAGAQRAYRNFATMKEDFRTRAGFLRWLTFNDGPHGYALGLWRSPEDVTAFTAGAAHQSMVREQHDRPSSTASSPASGPRTPSAGGCSTANCAAPPQQPPRPAAPDAPPRSLTHSPAPDNTRVHRSGIGRGLTLMCGAQSNAP